MTARRLAVAAVTAVVIYAALMLAWPVVGDAWTRAVAWTCDVLLASPGWGARARYTADPAIPGAIALHVTHADHPEQAEMSLGARERTYLPAAFALALTLASPIHWRRRFAAAPAVLLMIAVFVLFEGWACALDALARWPGNALGFRDWGRSAVHVVYVYACEVPTTAVLVPLLAWAVAAARWIRLAPAPPNADVKTADQR